MLKLVEAPIRGNWIINLIIASVIFSYCLFSLSSKEYEEMYTRCSRNLKVYSLKTFIKYGNYHQNCSVAADEILILLDISSTSKH